MQVEDAINVPQDSEVIVSHESNSLVYIVLNPASRTTENKTDSRIYFIKYSIGKVVSENSEEDEEFDESPEELPFKIDGDKSPEERSAEENNLVCEIDYVEEVEKILKHYSHVLFDNEEEGLPCLLFLYLPPKPKEEESEIKPQEEPEEIEEQEHIIQADFEQRPLEKLVEKAA